MGRKKEHKAVDKAALIKKLAGIKPSSGKKIETVLVFKDNLSLQQRGKITKGAKMEFSAEYLQEASLGSTFIGKSNPTGRGRKLTNVYDLLANKNSIANKNPKSGTVLSIENLSLSTTGSLLVEVNDDYSNVRNLTFEEQRKVIDGIFSKNMP